MPCNLFEMFAVCMLSISYHPKQYCVLKQVRDPVDTEQYVSACTLWLCELSKCPQINVREVRGYMY